MSDAQAHITAFWSTVAPGYEAHGGNVAVYGSEEYGRWVDALGAVLSDPPSDVLDVATGHRLRRSGRRLAGPPRYGHRPVASDA